MFRSRQHYSHPVRNAELFNKDWVLRHFAGLRNLPAPPRALIASELAQYEGHYTRKRIFFDDQVQFGAFQLTGRPDGTLQVMPSGIETLEQVFTFYADDYVINKSSGTPVSGYRSDFLRDESGAVVWLRFGGRLYRRGGSQPQAPVAAPSNEEL